MSVCVCVCVCVCVFSVVVGAKEMAVASAEELLGVFEMGNALRHTGTTKMNEHSSRSHAILTLQVNICCHGNNNSSSLKSVRSSKLCLVDLAGSERAGKTGNTGTRLKESVHINTGLLALGNVIRALSDHGRNRRGNRCSSAHVPYRDAKITRLLRDSLGGNTHTLMVACVSPSHHSVAETLSVLQFATKARHVRNCPGAVSTHTEVKPRPDSWSPAEARLEELEYEVKTLRELLKEKEKDMEMERKKTGGGGGKGDGFGQSGQIRVPEPEPEQKVNQETAWQYCRLVQEAAALLTDLSDPPSVLFKQRLQNWQQRLTAVNQSHHMIDTDSSEDYRDQTHHLTLLKLGDELNQCQDVLSVKEQIIEEKDAEQKQKEVEKLLEERRSLLLALEKEKERTRLQTEQLVNQQILIDRLRSDLVTFHGTTSGATVEAKAPGYLYNRPHSVPLIRHSCAHRPARKIHSSPPACSLERVMAAFKMRGHLLLAEIEEKDKVYCPFIEQQAESNEISLQKGEEEEEEEEEEDGVLGRSKFRRSLNRTWTSRQKKLPRKEKSSSPAQIHDGDVEVQQRTKDSVESQPYQRQAKTVRRASPTERRIHELTVNMRMKEELIKEIDKTERETAAADRRGRLTGESDLLLRLSTQSQQVRAEVYRSLQHMRLQRAQLKELRDGNREKHQNRGQSAENSAVFKHHQEESNKMLCDGSWLEEEEEHVLRKRAELQELEEERRRREEVLLRREDCLQRKNKIEIKMLRSSQALSRDLLHVSMQLESVEEQLQSSSGVRKAGGVPREELEKERDVLTMKRDTLDAKLRDNRVLTVDEEHSLQQLEEAIEALDEALKFKNKSIEAKKEQFSVTDSSLRLSQSAELAQHRDFTRKLKKLSPAEAVKLLIKYFNKVVCLREVERQLRFRCEELELHVDEREAALREMEAAMQRLVLDADRRLTQQHRDHQNSIQLLLQKLKEDVSEEAMQDRLQHLEKELFFYKSSSRQLKKKFKELLSDSVQPDNQPSHKQMPNTQIHKSANKVQAPSQEVKKTYIAATYTKVHTEGTDAKTHGDSSDYLQRTEESEHNQVLTPPHGRSARGQAQESVEMTHVRVCRRELRQISVADLQVSGSATRRQQTGVEASTESMMEDSIEVPRKTDR
uniref:Kinesin family member 27 n=1 Tax=Kryptolebias marmoratus TaxID=37003 RepID=A0A3Q3BPX8_KRYMA